MFKNVSIVPATQLAAIGDCQIKMGLYPAVQDDKVPFPFASFVPEEIAKPSCEFQSPFLLEIPDGYVWGKNGTVIISKGPYKGSIVAETAMEWGPFLDENTFKEHEAPVLKNFDGTLAVIACKNPHYYYHWMLEVLPRLFLLKDVYFDAICLHTNDFPFQKETLEKFGLEECKIVRTANDTYMQANTIVVPSFPGPHGYVPQWVCDLLKQKFLDPEDLTKTPTKKIYLSRSTASSRKIVNENALWQYLESQGFERFFLEKLSVKQQAQLFSSSTCVVAPHGSGLTNLVFCQPHTKVIEIFTPQWVNPCFWRLCNTLNLDYQGVMGSEESLSHSQHVSKDVWVDLDAVKELLL